MHNDIYIAFYNIDTALAAQPGQHQQTLKIKYRHIELFYDKKKQKLAFFIKDMHAALHIYIVKRYWEIIHTYIYIEREREGESS